MGQGAIFECKKCGYRANGFEGVGFAFPRIYQEVQRDARDGRYGREIQQFLEEHPGGQVSAERIMVVCEDCGHIESVPQLNMYVPKDGYDPAKAERGRWSVAFPHEGAVYLTGYEFSEHYTLVKKYQHICERCGGKMKRPPRDQKEFRCPVCGEVLEEQRIDWD